MIALSVKVNGNRGRMSLIQHDEETLMRLLWLLPEDVRRQVARTVWFDLEQSVLPQYPRLRVVADLHRLDGEIPFTVDEYVQALIVVGYPPLKAQWRADVLRQQIERERRGVSPAERVRIMGRGEEEIEPPARRSGLEDTESTEGRMSRQINAEHDTRHEA